MQNKSFKNWQTMKGIFISFEGIEGTGKSTHIEKLAEFLKQKGYDIIITREPGGTKIGKEIRNILLSPENKEIEPLTELFLLLADRHQNVKEIILPALKQGKIVITDRHADASVAYQGYGRNINIELVNKLNNIATQGIVPDITILLEVDDIRQSVEKAKKTDSQYRNGDRIEQESIEFHKRVMQGYQNLARENKERIYKIKIKNSIDDTQKEIRKIIMKKLKEKGL